MASSWFAFFGRDFLAATLGWSAEERGHYITLLVAQWEQDGLPQEMSRLELISPGISGCWGTVGAKFPVSVGGRRRNTRLEHERHLANERSERARQSASARWASKGDSTEAIDGECVTQCVTHCSEPCSGDAAMTMSYSPPPPPPPPVGETEVPEGWDALRDAWNAVWSPKRQWRSSHPPLEAIDRLREPGWLQDALVAIPEIKRGACSGFRTPPTFRQFCKRDPEKGTFVSRLLGGEFTDPERESSFRRRPVESSQ
jgi:hypothetical protein